MKYIRFEGEGKAEIKGVNIAGGGVFEVLSVNQP